MSSVEGRESGFIDARQLWADIRGIPEAVARQVQLTRHVFGSQPMPEWLQEELEENRRLAELRRADGSTDSWEIREFDGPIPTSENPQQLTLDIPGLEAAEGNLDEEVDARRSLGTIALGPGAEFIDGEGEVIDVDFVVTRKVQFG